MLFVVVPLISCVKRPATHVTAVGWPRMFGSVSSLTPQGAPTNGRGRPAVAQAAGAGTPGLVGRHDLGWLVHE